MRELMVMVLCFTFTKTQLERLVWFRSSCSIVCLVGLLVIGSRF